MRSVIYTRAFEQTSGFLLLIRYIERHFTNTFSFFFHVVYGFKQSNERKTFHYRNRFYLYNIQESHDGVVSAVKWSPVDRVVATGGEDRKVKLWDVSKGKLQFDNFVDILPP